MYEVFDHTADLGLRIRAEDLNTLFAEAGRGFSSLIVDDPDSIQPADEAEFAVEGTELEYLLFDWLNELLYRFEMEERLFTRFGLQVTDTGLTGKGWGETVDPQRHQLSHEVKAITYHGLKVEQTDAGWLAEVIVDI